MFTAVGETTATSTVSTTETQPEESTEGEISVAGVSRSSWTTAKQILFWIDIGEVKDPNQKPKKYIDFLRHY